MSKNHVWVIGHKNPDTDSICAAITYANLKNILEEKKPQSDRIRFVPKRAGAINSETAFVLDYFHEDVPDLVIDVGTQVKDINYRKTEGIEGHYSMKKAWEMMKILKIVTLPIVDHNKVLEGLIVTGDVATSYMDIYDNTILGRAKTQYRNIIDTLEARLVVGNEHAYFTKGKVLVGAGTPEMISESVEADDLVIMSNSQEAQLTCISKNCACLIITCGLDITQKVRKAAEAKDITIISTPYDTFTAARLINQSIPIKYFMTKENIVYFSEDDYLDEVSETVSKIRHRDFPVVDASGHYVGMFSRRNLINARKKQIIMVDHNEISQAVKNIEEAEILEIIDHHRIGGSLQTMAPVYFRNQPLGCTGTIIYQMYMENGVEITPQIAGLLCSQILSDTLVFRSPTCTQLDQDVCMHLADIAGISIDEYSAKMFEAGSDFVSKTEEEIINMDFKIFYVGSIAFGVSQVSAMNQKELDNVKDRIYPFLESQMEKKNLSQMYVMLTNIRKEATTLIYKGEHAADIAAEAFDCACSDDSLYLRGVVSRKKQMIPELIRGINDLGLSK